ncbi:hypothetical protein V3C99_014534 [Haemonchus contortus]
MTMMGEVTVSGLALRNFETRPKDKFRVWDQAATTRRRMFGLVSERKAGPAAPAMRRSVQDREKVDDYGNSCGTTVPSKPATVGMRVQSPPPYLSYQVAINNLSPPYHIIFCAPNCLWEWNVSVVYDYST